MARLAIFAALLAVSASALPLHKRIAQTTIDAVTPWEQACNTAGGGQNCNTIAVTAAGTLLAAPPPCAQQDSADAMITLAKSLNNNADMIRLAQIFRQQPRNSPDSLASLYCQTAPKNQELNGLFQCQFAGVNEALFTGNVKAGAAGTVPLGLTSLNPAGSCPANPSGPVTDGAQLNTIVQSPGTGSTAGNNANSGNNGSATSTAATSSVTPAPTSGSGKDKHSNKVTVTVTQVQTVTVTAAGSNATPTVTPAATNGAAASFKLQNGLDAQKLNKSFTSLTANSACTDGQTACVGGGFAQCVGGKFAISQCSGGTQCFALPLVNKAGTSLTCDTQADAEARIAATGAKGGLQG